MAKKKNRKVGGVTLTIEEHEKRKLENGKPDLSYSSIFQVNGKQFLLRHGFLSKGMDEEIAVSNHKRFQKNAIAGVKPTSYKEEKQLRKEKELQEQAEQEEEQKKVIKFHDFWNDVYLPEARDNKNENVIKEDLAKFKSWLKPSLCDRQLSSITTKHLNQLYKDITTDLTDKKGEIIRKARTIRTAERTLLVLNQVLKLARNKGYLETIPQLGKHYADAINKNDNSRKRYLSVDEANQLLPELRKRSENVYEQALISIQLGLRAGEVLGLKWQDINLANDEINLKDTKNKGSRTIKLTKKVRDMLTAKYKDQKPSELVWPDRFGRQSKAISKTYFRVADKLFNEGVEDSKEKVIFHTCRHTCASWLVMKGVSLYTVQRVLGHKSIQVTERYAHLAPNQLELAAKTIDEIDS